MSMYRFIPLLLVFCACASTNPHSGFLEDYSVLEPNAAAEGARAWVAPTFVDYDHYLVEPFVAYFHPNVQGKPINPNELDYLLTHLRGALIGSLTDDYLLARQPGPGVLRIEVAVTDLHEQGGKDSGLGLLGASVEMRGTDSETGDLVIAAMRTRGLRDLDLSGAGSAKWAPARALAQRWAEWLKQEVDRARRLHGARP